MMDTVLNLGLNDESVEGLAKQTGDERFAFDSYRRFIAMYARIVLELPGEEFDSLFDAAKELAGTTSDAKVPTELLRYLVDSYQQIVERHTGKPFPQRPTEQLRGAIEAVFRSWNGPRAIAYREREHIAARPRHRRQRAGHGLRQPRRQLGHRCRVHPRPRHRGEGRLRRLPGQRPGRGRGGGHPQHRAHLGAEEAVPQGPRRAAQDLRPARGALPGHVRHRVHHRTGQALDAPDPGGQAHRRRRAPRWRSTWCARATSGSPRPRPSRGSPRTTSTLSCTPNSPARATRSGPRAWVPARAPRWAASTSRRTTPRRQPSAASRSSWCATRRHPRTCTACWPSEGILTARGGLVSHAAVVARGWGKPAVVGAEALRLGDHQVTVGDVTLYEGDWVSLDGGSGDRRRRSGAAHGGVAAARVRHRPLLGRRDPQGPLGRPGQRRHRRRRRQRTPARRRGHRPVPHRAHVPRRGPPARRAPDDPGRLAGRGGRRARGAAAWSSARTSSPSWPRWTGCRSRCACSTRPLHEFLPSTEELAHKEATVGLNPEERRLYEAALSWKEANPMLGTRGVRLGGDQARPLRHAGAGPHGGGPRSGWPTGGIPSSRS